MYWKFCPFPSNPWQTWEASETFHICFPNLHHRFCDGRRKWVPLSGGVFAVSEDSKLSGVCNRLHVNKPAALAASASELIFWLKNMVKPDSHVLWASRGRTTHRSLRHSAASLIHREIRTFRGFAPIMGRPAVLNMGLGRQRNNT